MEAIPVALYDRLSTEAQAEEGYAQEGHLRELREEMAATGRVVVEEIAEAGEKRWMFDRPGVLRLLELARAGAVSEIWAWSWTRFGEGSVPARLEEELADLGCTLRALDDGGEGLGGKILRAVGGVLSSEEQEARVRRSRMGKRSKARAGRVMGSGRGPRYGFALLRNEKGKATGYEVEPSQMAVVRRILSMLASGSSIHAVLTALERDGVRAPRGGALWSRTTVRNAIVLEDSYLPHSRDELEALVAEGLLSREVFDALDPQRPYGVDYFNRTRSRRVSRQTKKRRVEPAPRSEWVAVPVDLTGSGLTREHVEAARLAIANNKAPAKVRGDRGWTLSRGFLFCADCGRSMTAYSRTFEDGTVHFSYRCEQRIQTRGTRPPCPNRRSRPAEDLEHVAASLFEETVNPRTLTALYDEAVERQEQEAGTAGAQERLEALRVRLEEVAAERKGLARQAARGVLSDSELDELLADLDAERDALLSEARSLEAAASEARRARALRSNLLSPSWFEDPDSVQPHELFTVGSGCEEVRAAYRRMGARFEVGHEGTLTLRLELPLEGSSTLGLTSTRRCTAASCRAPRPRRRRANP